MRVTVSSTTGVPVVGTDDFVEIQGRDEKTTLGSVIAVGIVVIALTGGICFAVRPKTAQKLETVYPAAVVSDEAGIMDNEQALATTLEEYHDLTGICPVVMTVYDEDWEAYYDDLQKYTLKQYADNYNDYYHFVVVCSVSENGTMVEAINGPDTNSFITDSMLNSFTARIRNDIKKGTAPADAVNNAFRYMLEDADSRLHPFANKPVKYIFKTLYPLLISVAVFAVILVLVSRKFRKDKKAHIATA